MSVFHDFPIPHKGWRARDIDLCTNPGAFPKRWRGSVIKVEECFACIPDHLGQAVTCVQFEDMDGYTGAFHVCANHFREWREEHAASNEAIGKIVGTL